MHFEKHGLGKDRERGADSRIEAFQVADLNHAVEALRGSNGGKLPVNLKFIFEGEEETGGHSIEEYVPQHTDKLKADVALIEAWQADRWGNLTFRKSGRNFNPVMATAADCTIVQAQHIVQLGALDPECIVTPGIFVDRVLHVPYGDPPV
jgi:acyl CoA:acetate/3-ketoacid CoA transferase alpha subunit